MSTYEIRHEAMLVEQDASLRAGARAIASQFIEIIRANPHSDRVADHIEIIEMMREQHTDLIGAAKRRAALRGAA